MKHLQQGFTLIELMIITLILAILATIAYPSYDTFVENSRIESARADLLANAQLLERFYAQNHTFPTNAASIPFPLKENTYFDITLVPQNAAAAASGYTLQATPKTEGANRNYVLLLSDNGIVVQCPSNESTNSDGSDSTSNNSSTTEDCKIK